MNPFANSPAHRLRSAYLRMHRVTNRIFRPYGVTADQYVVLRLLSEADGMSQQQLAAVCASDPTTLGRMLELLEQKEFVERRPLESDLRTRLVFITRAGRQMVRQLYEVALPIRDAIDAAVSDATMKTLLRGLLQLGEAMADLEQDATPAGDGAYETSPLTSMSSS